MSAPTVTEREAVLREREAFEAGAESAITVLLNGKLGQRAPSPQDRAKVRYPLPKIERPRVVKDPEPSFAPREWAVIDGRLRIRIEGAPCSTWITPDASWGYDNPARLALWLDLHRNPTELVDDEEGGQ